MSERRPCEDTGRRSQGERPEKKPTLPTPLRLLVSKIVRE